MNFSPFSKLLMAAVAAATLSVSPLALADESTNAQADNSGNNAKDRDANAVTPLDQSEASADVAITSKIRRAVVRDTSLSEDAHNIKIITTKDRMVYLRGPVASDQECKTIETIAKRKAGTYHVMNELSVAGNK